MTKQSAPSLLVHARTEAPEIASVRGGLASRHAVVAMQADDPVGAGRLRALTGAALASAAE